VKGNLGVVDSLMSTPLGWDKSRCRHLRAHNTHKIRLIFGGNLSLTILTQFVYSNFTVFSTYEYMR